MDNGHLDIEEIEELSRKPGSAGNQSHVDNCPQCKSLLEEYQAVGANLQKLASVWMGASTNMNCPDERVWFDVAAGTLPEAEALQYTQHAAECNLCGKKLTSAMKIFEGELSPEEEKTLAALPSSSVKAQQELAQRLANDNTAAPVTIMQAHEKPKRSFWKPLSFSLAGAATVVAAILVIILFNRHDSSADVGKLIAQTYSENRTIEMRIPGAEHAEMHQQRSGESTSILSTSAAARKAADEIEVELKKNPDRPEWLIFQAQLDLLDWHYRAALSTLNKVETGAESTQFLLTQALALYEQGEIEHNPQVQHEAVDILGRVLQKDPQNKIALFNEAIVCEELYLYDCAEKNWKQLVSLENEQGWAAEAREHLSRIQEKKNLDH